MKDKVFFDTNIILYSYSNSEHKKSEISNKLMTKNNNIVISVQVINEVVNILFKKYKLNTNVINDVVIELENNFNIYTFSIKTQKKAIYIKEKYKLQYYDSLIIATALENNCSLLYSEDMHDGLVIDNILTIKNPYKNIN